MYFTDDTKLQRFEREMKIVPNFERKEVWEYVDSCRDCKNYKCKLESCMEAHCPYLKRKIRSNSIITRDLVEAYYFVDMNPDPKLTEIARCITARQNAGIGRRKAERSGVFIEEIDEKAPFAVLIVDKNGEYHVGRIRRLTPRECWRLQGFTDEQFDRAVGVGISDSQLYKMAGNAVSVPVITAIGRVIKEVEERNTQNA